MLEPDHLTLTDDLTPIHINRTLKESEMLFIIGDGRRKSLVHDWEKLVSAGYFNDASMLLDGSSPVTPRR
jgi:hypothetical protein